MPQDAFRSATDSTIGARDDLALLRRAVRRRAAGDRADDLFQEAWLVLNRCESVRNLEAYLDGVVRRLLSGLRRSERARHRREVAAARCCAVPFESELERREEHERVQAAVERLPALYREVIELRYVAELSSPEIATLLGTPPATVRTRLSRALARLRTVLVPEPAAN